MGEIAAVGQCAGAQRAIAFDHALAERQQQAKHVFEPIRHCRRPD